MPKVQDFSPELLGSFIAILGAKVESRYHAEPRREEELESKFID